MWDALILAFAVTAAIGDLRWGTIPREFTTAGFLAGLLYHGFAGNLMSAALAGILGFAVGLTLFRLGAIGGGDVKLIAALGAMLSLGPWIIAMSVALVASALIAVAQAAYRCVLWRMAVNAGRLAVWLVTSGGKPHPGFHIDAPGALRAPFGGAAALGTACALLMVRL
jgi:prepilin peptidase CpaA